VHCDICFSCALEIFLLTYLLTVDTTVNATKFAVYSDYKILLRYLVEFSEIEFSETRVDIAPLRQYSWYNSQCSKFAVYSDYKILLRYLVEFSDEDIIIANIKMFVFDH